MLPKILICWVGTPIGAIIISIILYLTLGRLWDALTDRFGMHTLDTVLYCLTIAVGCYGSYALGANNIANVVGVFAPLHPFNIVSQNMLCGIGAVFICIGAAMYGKSVMFTVGQEIVSLEPFTAFIAVLSEALIVHIYALVGVPVSTTQAIVGGVLGIGLIKGVQAVNTRTLINIVIGWLSTPLVAGVLAFAAYKLVFVLLLPVK